MAIHSNRREYLLATHRSKSCKGTKRTQKLVSVYKANRMRNMLATLALYATLLFCSSATSNAQDKTPLFIFGDSLYDTGMSAYGGVKGVGAKYWPYSQKPGKRYSNGLVIPDFIGIVYHICHLNLSSS